MYLVCGESLFDVFLDGEDTTGGLHFAARCGGSPFNVAIGIARLGGKAALLSGIARDMLGEHLIRTLEKESVSTEYLIRPKGHTTLSLVGVDRLGQPHYTFYGLGSADCNVTERDLPEIGSKITGLHFGSYSLVVPPGSDSYLTFAKISKDLFVSIDPNVRTTVEPDRQVWKSRISQFASCVDLLKMSMEDFRTLYPNTQPRRKAKQWIASGVKLVILTDGANRVSAWSQNASVVRIMPSPIKVVDTVGAGDSFQAALLTKLWEDGGGYPKAAIKSIDEARLRELLQFAVDCALITCQRRGADLPHREDLTGKIK